MLGGPASTEYLGGPKCLGGPNFNGGTSNPCRNPVGKLHQVSYKDENHCNKRVI